MIDRISAIFSKFLHVPNFWVKVRNLPYRISVVVFRKESIWFILLYFLLVLLVRVDISSKDVVFKYLSIDMEGSPIKDGFFEVLPFFKIVMVKNYGISFGMFKSAEQGRFLLSTMVTAIIFVFFVYLHLVKTMLHRLSVVLVLGGAIGNLYDRIAFGYVRDFLDFYFYDYHFPAFNFADVFVFCGVCMLILIDIVANSAKNIKE